ncbi:hypothetical protein PROFUN_03279 [Planoprotostelium fungivorum]|uniref:Uncharacterized protein n=1 Tax=Planoprotostelium fungivorum TaxID=1890364 RepID=A0A2P6NWM2_9EUKA|nr:hypothetical protein PROFUN_03279 [Planoprotostelium fungivorum]
MKKIILNPNWAADWYQHRSTPGRNVSNVSQIVSAANISTNLPATINTNVTISFLSLNADVLPGLGTAILRTPQPRQTLACLHRRDPRKGCSTPARIKHFRDFICAVDAKTYSFLPEGNTGRTSSIGCRSAS